MPAQWTFILTNRLTDSTQAIIVDDFSFEKRLKKFTEPLVIFKYGINNKQEDETNTLFLKYIPDRWKPMSLRSTIKEDLMENEMVVERDPGLLVKSMYMG